MHHMLDIVVEQLLRKFISWPDSERQKETSDYYKSRFKFPGVIGAIDGTHISVSRPPGEFFPEDYFSIRKKIYTMLLQVKIISILGNKLAVINSSLEHVQVCVCLL